MPRLFRLTLWSMLLGAAIALIPSVQTRMDTLYYRLADQLDSRPEKQVLFIGNSHTFTNDMPWMVRKIADAHDAPYKYAIHMHAPPATQFIDHWKNARIHRLLERKWDYIVLQGGSNETMLDGNRTHFHAYGNHLLGKIWQMGVRPILFVTWQYAPDYPFVIEHPELRNSMYSLIQTHYGQLAARNNAVMVNVGKAWAHVLRYRSDIALYTDGNHATIHGSYLAALMFYRNFSGDSLSYVGYIPSGVTEEEAEYLMLVANKVMADVR